MSEGKSYDEEECSYYFDVPFRSERVAAEAAKPELKVGDRVLVDGGYSFDPSYGAIAEQSGLGFYVRIQGRPHGDDVWYYQSSEIKLAQEPFFTIGKRVKLVKNTLRYAVGETGVVEDAYGSMGVGLRMDKDGCYYAVSMQEIATDCAERKVEQGEPELSEAAIAATFATAPKPKFKAGDVVCVVDAGGGGALGDQATVSSIDWDPSLGTYYYGLDGLSKGAVGLYEWRLELVGPANVHTLKLEVDTSALTETLATIRTASGPAIVIRIDDGKPKPAYCPHVHSSIQSATTEAERLASNNPGKQFDVYVRATGRVAEKHIEVKEVA